MAHRKALKFLYFDGHQFSESASMSRQKFGKMHGNCIILLIWLYLFWTNSVWLNWRSNIFWESFDLHMDLMSFQMWKWSDQMESSTYCYLIIKSNIISIAPNWKTAQRCHLPLFGRIPCNCKIYHTNIHVNAHSTPNSIAIYS